MEREQDRSGRFSRVDGEEGIILVRCLVGLCLFIRIQIGRKPFPDQGPGR
jgi:hypothetical protein